MKRKTLITAAAWAVIIAGVSVAAFFVMLRLFGPGEVMTWYEIAVEYDQMPDDDRALRSWLEGQPGVEGVRVGRDGKRVEVNYRQKPGQTLPDLFGACERL